MRTRKNDLDDNNSVSALINVLNEIDYADMSTGVSSLVLTPVDTLVVMSEKRDQMGARMARTGSLQQLSIRHLTKIYSSSRITKEKKTFIDYEDMMSKERDQQGTRRARTRSPKQKTIRDSQTRSMAILTILRNRKDW